MCGWVGTFGMLADEQTVSAAADLMASRGPDGKGVRLLGSDGRAGAVGHRQLAILGGRGDAGVAGAMIGSSDELPMSNDCWQIGSDRLEALAPARRTDRLIVLADSGYVVANPTGDVHLVMDVGDPCPASLPAHAHADCLTFELYLDGERVIVNSGTSTYEPGPQRDFERSTAAHNTVVVDGHNQTEVWGTFRAGRRAHGRLQLADDDGSMIMAVASHDGYRHLDGSPVHRREVRLDAKRVEVFDVVEGDGVHAAELSLHLTTPAASRLQIGIDDGPISPGGCEVSGRFGERGSGARWASVAGPAPLPLSIGWSVSW